LSVRNPITRLNARSAPAFTNDFPLGRSEREGLVTEEAERDRPPNQRCRQTDFVLPAACAWNPDLPMQVRSQPHHFAALIHDAALSTILPR
jgi:hypothetical protein